MSVDVKIVPGDARFTTQAVLDGVTYTLQFAWNVRLSSWFMDVLDSQGIEVLQTGLRLVANWPLAAYTTGRSPPGAFVALDTSGAGADPALLDFGGRVKLKYFTAAELGL